jgi:hypothetical protein
MRLVGRVVGRLVGRLIGRHINWPTDRLDQAFMTWTKLGFSESATAGITVQPPKDDVTTVVRNRFKVRRANLPMKTKDDVIKSLPRSDVIKNKELIVKSLKDNIKHSNDVIRTRTPVVKTQESVAENPSDVTAAKLFLQVSIL